MAAFMPEDTMIPEVEQLLMCHVCLHPMLNRSPRQLKCLHTFCTPCLEDIANRIRRLHRAVTCPSCRTVTELPQGSISKLPINFAIQQADEMARSLGKLKMCMTCVRNGELIYATVRCGSCDLELCDACHRRHDNFGGFERHAVKRISGHDAGIKGDYCVYHESPYIHGCHSCRVPLCRFCLFDGEHDSHPDSICNLAEEAKRIRCRLLNQKERSEMKIVEIMSQLETERGTIKYFEEVQKEIEDTAEKMKAAINQQMGLLLDEIQQTYLDISHDRLGLLTQYLQREQDQCQSLANTLEERDGEIIKVKDVSMQKENDSALQASSTVHLKELAKVSFVAGSEPFLGELNNGATGCHDTKTLHPESDGKKAVIINRFPAHNLKTDLGIGSLWDGTAVLVSIDGMALYACREGLQSELKTRVPVSRISGYMGIVHCGLINGDKVSEVTMSKRRMKIRKEYPVPCTQLSYLVVDSEDNIVISHATGECDVRKYDSRGRVLWKKDMRAKSGIRVAGMSNSDGELYIISNAKEVHVWDTNGKHVNKLKLQRGLYDQTLAGITSTNNGTILVADKANHTVSEYSVNGSFIKHVLTEADGIKHPECLSCDQSGLLWVSEYGDTFTEPLQKNKGLVACLLS